MPRSTLFLSLAFFAVAAITPVFGCSGASATLIEDATTPAAATTPGPAIPAAPSPVASTLAALDPPELRAVWVDAFHDGFKTPAQVDELVAWARQANFNALFVQVRRRGDAYYARAFEPRTEDPDLAPGFDALGYLIERAHQGPQPLQVHAWLATLPIWNKRDTSPGDPSHVFNRHGLDDARLLLSDDGAIGIGDAPAGMWLDGEPTGREDQRVQGVPARTWMDNTWLMLRDDGAAWAGDGSAGTYYLDPGHPEAARYTADVYLNVVRNYDVDGIHLDYVRYFEGDGDRRWGYNPVSVARFNQLYARDPGGQPDPSDPDWMAWRRDQVTALVRRIYLETKAVKPQVAVSGAVVAWGNGPDTAGGWERSAPSALVFQDWRHWLQEGIVDYVLPMDYYREATTQAGWFDGWVSWQQANRGKRAVVIGLGAYLNQPEETMAQLQRARAVGPLGIAVYSYAVPAKGADGDPSASRADLLSHLQAAFSRPAPIPDLPWHTHASTGNVLIDVPGREDVAVTLAGPVAYHWRTDGTGLAGGLDVPPGTYTVAVSCPDIDPTPVTLAVHPDETSVLRFVPRTPAW